MSAVLEPEPTDLQAQDRPTYDPICLNCHVTKKENELSQLSPCTVYLGEDIWIYTHQQGMKGTAQT
ncbi:hypothetical protein OSTOST_06660, partial [Ostertagia ostertagi]